MTLKILFIQLLGFCIDNTITLFLDIIHGKPATDGTILILANSQIKTILAEHMSLNRINAAQNETLRFVLLSHNTEAISCADLNFRNNRLYIYTHNGKICKDTDNSVKALANRVNIPYYLQILGYSALHFEFFGNFLPNFAPEDNLRKIMHEFPADSTIIITAINTVKRPSALNDELLLEAFSQYSPDAYVQFAHYIMRIPGQLLLATKTETDIEFFYSQRQNIYQNIEDFLKFWMRQADYNGSLKEFLYLQFKEDSINSLLEHHHNSERYNVLSFFDAITADDTERAQLLLDQGISPNSALHNGMTALFISAYFGHTTLAKILINYGATIDSLDQHNTTPLIIASFNKHKDIIDLLLSHGANPDAQDINGNTAMIISARAGNTDIIELLLQYNGNHQITNKNGETALNIAVQYNNMDTIKLILEKTSDNIHDLIMKTLFNYQYNIASLLAEHELKRNCDIKLLQNSEVISYLLAHERNEATILSILSDFEHHYRGEYVEEISKVRDCIFGYDNALYDGVYDVCNFI